MLSIKRGKDKGVIKCVLHRTADIPGGVGISTAKLGGSALLEGTPIGKGVDELYEVCKTVKTIAESGASPKKLVVSKGHHFKEGDYIAAKGCNGAQIASIDKSNPEKDEITLKKPLGGSFLSGTCLYESAGETDAIRVTPIAVAGSNEDVEQGANVFVSAWVIGVVREENAPAVNGDIKALLKGIVYV